MIPVNENDRTKSMQRDNKDSPSQPQTQPSSVNNYTGANILMGGHLASGNLRSNREPSQWLTNTNKEN